MNDYIQSNGERLEVGSEISKGKEPEWADKLGIRLPHVRVFAFSPGETGGRQFTALPARRRLGEPQFPQPGLSTRSGRSLTSGRQGGRPDDKLREVRGARHRQRRPRVSLTLNPGYSRYPTQPGLRAP